jgi:Tol biopolymer transport system component
MFHTSRLLLSISTLLILTTCGLFESKDSDLGYEHYFFLKSEGNRILLHEDGSSLSIIGPLPSETYNYQFSGVSGNMFYKQTGDVHLLDVFTNEDSIILNGQNPFDYSVSNSESYITYNRNDSIFIAEVGSQNIKFVSRGVHPFFTSDDNHILFSDTIETIWAVLKYSIQTGSIQRLTSADDDYKIRGSSGDRNKFLVASGDFEWHIIDGEGENMLDLQFAHETAGSHWMSNSGTKMWYVHHPSEQEITNLYIVSVDGVSLEYSTTQTLYQCWIPYDEDYLYITENSETEEYILRKALTGDGMIDTIFTSTEFCCAKLSPVGW